MLIYNKISRHFAPLLVLMILVSSMSYSVDFHYCQGQLKSFSLIGKAKNCHEMAAKKSTCKHHKANEDSLASDSVDKKCCNNETVYFESDLDKQIVSFDFIDIDLSQFESAFSSTVSSNYVEFFKQDAPYLYYKPPLIRKDIPVLFETFLI